MNNQQIIRCLQECATKLKIDINISSLKHIDTNTRHYDLDEVAEFQRDLVEAANDAGMVLIEKTLDRSTLKELITDNKTPLIIFIEQEGSFYPAFIKRSKRKTVLEFITNNADLSVLEIEDFSSIKFSLTKSGEILTLSCFAYQSIINPSP